MRTAALPKTLCAFPHKWSHNRLCRCPDLFFFGSRLKAALAWVLCTSTLARFGSSLWRQGHTCSLTNPGNMPGDALAVPGCARSCHICSAAENLHFSYVLPSVHHQHQAWRQRSICPSTQLEPGMCSLR